MAMSIPTLERTQQLEAGDVGLFSFGWGKPMYAGWGGIACFKDIELAGRVREIRDRWSTQESPGLRFWRSCSMLLRVSMNQRHVYGLFHEQRLYRFYKKLSSSQNEQGLPSKACGRALQLARGPAAQSLPPKWTRPTTALNRRLALCNLHRSRENADLRCRQAEIYFRCLVRPGIVRGSGAEAVPQSHYPIRLSSAARDKMCDYLRGRGIDTGTLFPLPVELSRDGYPHAAETADEVITLPLGPTLTLAEVQMVSRCVKGGLRELGF